MKKKLKTRLGLDFRKKPSLSLVGNMTLRRVQGVNTRNTKMIRLNSEIVRVKLTAA
jgi:hypothetical protein